MKTVVGTDLIGAYKPALELFKRLGVVDASVHFVNVVEPVLPDGSFPELADSHPISQILEDLTQAGKAALERAVQENPCSTSEVAFGAAARSLIDAADEHNADLLIVGSEEKSMLESFFAGSVTKALTTGCERPVLIGKKSAESSGELTVVVAHDLSEYCDQAIDRFIGWGPGRIGRVVLITADTTDPSIVAIVERNDPEMSGETIDLIQSKIEQKQIDIADKLAQICPRVERVVTQGSPKSAINEAMKNCNADLLVLGAHGHGFVERIVTGSLAMHMVVRERHSVLLMRA